MTPATELAGMRKEGMKTFADLLEGRLNAAKTAARQWGRDTRACLQPPQPGPQVCPAEETVHGYTVKCTHTEHSGPWHNDPVVGAWRRGWMS